MKTHQFLRNRYILIADLILITACVLGSFVLRLNLGPLFLDHLNRALVMLLIALILKPIVYFAFGLYRRLWIYASIQELKLIAVAVTSGSVLLSLVIVILQATQVFPDFSRGVLVIDWVLSIIAVGGLRFSLRIVADNQTQPNRSNQEDIRRVLVVGAGDAGVLVVREMQKNKRIDIHHNARLSPVGFVDDSVSKQNQNIHGVPVIGTLDDLTLLIDQHNIHEVIIAIPSAPGRVIRKVTEICRQKHTPFRTIPGLHEIIGGQVSISKLREVDITDLLRREPVKIDDTLVGISLKDRSVLVTGGGGSIGSELCRQIARWSPKELIILGHGENSVFWISRELEERYPSLAYHPVIADIRDRTRLQVIFERYRPQVVFHTAAHKHVTLMENNIEEAITNNIIGTKNIIDVSREFQVDRLVLISSDKAVQPTSIMGATKRIAEMLVLESAHKSNLAYSVVRFGNVLGSRGSILPIFKQQIERGGPITITHPDMKRYFMTIPEAVHLVLQASAMGSGGETFTLDMGEQVPILELAEDLIRLSGLEPGVDIDISFTGIQPGEKLSESLWDKSVELKPTDHPSIHQAVEEDILSEFELDRLIQQLIQLTRDGESAMILKLLSNVIPGASIVGSPQTSMDDFV